MFDNILGKAGTRLGLVSKAVSNLSKVSRKNLSRSGHDIKSIGRSIGYVVCVMFSLLSAEAAFAQLSKSAPTTADVGDNFTYTLNFTCPSTTAGNCTNVTFSDFIPAEVDYPFPTDPNYNIQTREWSNAIGTVNNGSTVQVSFEAFFPDGTLNGLQAVNSATVDFNGTTLTSNSITTTATNGFVYNFTNLPVLSKANGRVSEVTLASDVNVDFGHTFNSDVTNLVIEDELENAAGDWNGAILNGIFIRRLNCGVNYDLEFLLQDSNTDAERWVNSTGNPHTTATIVPNQTGDISGLLPALNPNEFVRGVRATYASTPGNGCFHPDNPNTRQLPRLVIGYGFDETVTGVTNPTLGQTGLENCAKLRSDSFTEQMVCSDIDIIEPSLQPFSRKRVVGMALPSYVPGDTIRYSIEIGNTKTSDFAITNPSIADVLDPNLEYIGNLTVSTSGSTANTVGSSSFEPTVTATPDFGGSGITRIDFNWQDADGSGITFPANTDSTITIQYDAMVSVSAANNSSLQNIAYFLDGVDGQEPARMTCGAMSRIRDTGDIDGDGSTTDFICAPSESINVGIPAGFAAIDSFKRVRGNLDTDFSRFPNSGQVSPGGNILYEINLSVPSTSAVIRDIRLVDVLPNVGDRGVVANDELRESTWRPEFTATTLSDLQAYVGGITGSELFVSSECEPCLNADLGVPNRPSCSNPNWVNATTNTAPITPLTNICAFRIDYGASFQLNPSGTDATQLLINMTAPTSVPTDGSIAWNSFGFVGTNDGNGIALLASEPIKVGISSLPDPNAGSITIIKDATVDDEQDFMFIASGLTPNTFTLDDDDNGILSNTQVYNDVSPGAYSFSEGAVTNWAVTDISCTGATNSTITFGGDASFDVGDTEVSVDLMDGEDIICTFTNTETSGPMMCPSGPAGMPVGFGACVGGNCPSAYLGTGENCGNAGVGVIGSDEGFSVFVGGDFTVTNNGAAEAEGVVAIRGNYIMNKAGGTGYNIGVAGLGSCVTAPAGQTHLYVGGTSTPASSAGGGVSILGALGVNGNAELGDQPTDHNYEFCGSASPGAAGCGELPINSTISNFDTFMADTLSEFNTISQCLSGFDVTTDSNVRQGTIFNDPANFNRVTLDCDAGIKVGGFCPAGIYIFEVDDATSAPNLDPGFVFEVVTSAFVDDGNTTLIVNVNDTGTVSVRVQPDGALFNSTFARNLMWNFSNASQVNFEGNSQVNGFVLIPNGGAEIRSSGMNGRFVAGGNVLHDSFGSEFHNFDFTGSLPASCGVSTPTTSSITIVKDAVPNDGQDFPFTATGVTPTNFSLDDDSDGTLSNTQVFSGLSAGTFTFDEASVANWNLTNLACTGATTSTINTSATGVSVGLACGEDIICTFTNTSTLPAGGTITIIKNTEPDAADDFAFTTTGGLSPASFNLDDDADGTLSNTQTYTNVTAGTYTVTETAAAGYTTSLMCVDPDGGTTVSDATATIDLDDDETVTCTYTNTRQPGTIVIVKDTVPDAGDDFVFTTTGGLSTANFSLDDDADGALSNTQTFSNVAEGSYTITETATPGYSTALSCDDPDDGTTTSGAVATIDVDAGETVTCTYTNTALATVTIIKNTVPDSATDFSFTTTGGFSPSAFDLDDDADGILLNTRVFSNVAPGSYTVSETVNSDYSTTISCTDPDDGSTSDGQTATLDVDAGESITCTFTNTLELVSIGNRVWMDNGAGADGIANNGIVDGNEVGVGGVLVELYESGESVTTAAFRTDTTEADGSYLFDSIPQGEYFVHIPASNFAAPSGALLGKVSTTGNGTSDSADDDVDENGIDTLDNGGISSPVYDVQANDEPESESGFQTNVVANQSTQDDNNTNLTIDFGFYEPVSIGNLVWMDNGAGADGIANNGIQDGDEVGVGGVTVELYSSTQTIGGANSGSVTTESDGSYVFNNVVPGDYRVHLPASNFDTGGVLVGKISTMGADAANVDTDQGGAANSDNGIDNIAPAIPVTNGISSNLYSFIGGSEPTTDVGDADDDSDAASSVARPTSDDNSTNFTIDFGVYEPVSIGNLVWMDNGAGTGGIANDGIRQSGESGIENVLVELYPSSVVDPEAATAPFNTTTDANGLYVFSVPPGEYFVHIPASNFADGEPLAEKVSTTGQGAADNEIDDNATGGDDGDDTESDGVSSLVYDLRANDEPESEGGRPFQAPTTSPVDDNNTNSTADFGFYAPVAIGNLVWMDNGAGTGGIANDGIKQSEEPGIGGVVVELYPSTVTTPESTTAPFSTTTASDGSYFFNNLVPGSYFVHIPASEFGDGQPLQNKVSTNGQGALDNAIDDSAGEDGDDVETDGVSSPVYNLLGGAEPTSETGFVGSTPTPQLDSYANATVDFGFLVPMSIGSFVWEDSNGNGFQESNEPPIANAELRLLLSNDDPAVDLNNLTVPLFTTGPDGLYVFDNLPAGDYKVVVTPPLSTLLPSPIQTPDGNNDAENDSNIAGDAAIAGSYESGAFSLVPGNELVSGNEPNEIGPDTFRGDNQDSSPGSIVDLNGNMTIDFGFVPRASIGNRVWLDQDMDGSQDANEDGIPNVDVTLTPPTSVVVDGPLTVTTGPNGEYLFPNLPVANGYVVDVTGGVPDGLVQTFDEDDGLGAINQSSGPIDLSPSEEHLTADFGYAPPAGVGSLGDTVWVDANDNGLQDPGEPGIPNVLVTLMPAPDVDLDGAGPNPPGTPDTVSTDSNGKYLFTNLLLNETYQVSVPETVDDYAFSSSGNGDPDVRDGNSTPADQDASTLVVLTDQNIVNLDADFGYLPPADQNNSVGDTIWRDVDGDGSGPNIGSIDGQNPPANGEGNDVADDATEEPIPSVTVSLINSDNDVVASTISNADGQYLFTGLPDGNYVVRVTDQNNVLAALDPSYDADGTASANESSVNLDFDSTDMNPVNDRSHDFGYVDNSPASGDGSIGDTIFFDENDNGASDDGEGIEGVTVKLFGPGPDRDISTTDDNQLLDTETTDENGNYLFADLGVTDLNGADSGTDYIIMVDTSTLPNGGGRWTNTVDPLAPDGDSMSITNLSSTSPRDVEQDFGYLGLDGNSLSGTVWSDSNGDGIQNEGSMLEGVTMMVDDQQGNIVRKMSTDATGDFSVNNLPDGLYNVVVTDDTNLLGQLELTDSPNGSSDTSDGTSKDDSGYRVDLDSQNQSSEGVSNTTADFGYEPLVTNPISLGSFEVTLIAKGRVRIEWATQTEVSNLGFNVYSQVDGEWQQLNAELINSQGDSIEVQSYSVTQSSSSTVFALSDIDLEGKETLHGPFRLGKPYGDIGERRTIDWQSELGERESKQAERERLRKEQQQQRNEQRRQRRLQQQSSVFPINNAQQKNRGVVMNTTTPLSVWSKSLVSAAMAVLVPSAYAADEFAEDIVNFKTTKAGIHQVSYQQLMDEFVDITDEPISRIALMNDGVSVPIVVSDQNKDGKFNQGSVIRFIAEQVNTLYSDTNVYTLRLDSGMAARASDYSRPTPSGPAATSYLAKRVFAPQARYSFASPDVSDPWYAASIVASGSQTSESMNIALDGYVPGGNSGASKAKLKVNLWGATNLPGSADDHHIKVDFNNVEVIDGRFDGLTEKQFSVPLNNVKEGNNRVRVLLPLDTGFDFDVVNVNEVEVSYPRKFLAEQNRLDFTSAHRKFRLLGFDKNIVRSLNDIVVMRKDKNGIANYTNPRLSCQRASCLLQFAGTGKLAEYYVSSVNDLHQPKIEALPVEQNIRDEAAAYLIISHPDFIGNAGDNLLEGLAADLRAEFGSAKIVDVDAVYAQFGKHIFSPRAIQDYIQYAVNNLDTQYVLLVGGDVYDYRQFENQNATSFIPSIYAPTGNNISFAPVDAKYVDLDDDNVPDLPIGRLPVRTTSQLRSLLNKRDSYLARDYANKILLVADEYDQVQQYSFSRDADEIADDFLNDFSVSKVYVDNVSRVSEARANIVDLINQGQSLTSFFGHSSTNQWAFNGLFTGNDAAALNNLDKPTVVTQWGCWNAYYVSPNEDSMGHRFMMEGDQGAVAVMGASTLTNANAERKLARMVFERISNGERIGDAVTNAKQEYAQDNPEDLDVLLGWTLLGLPDLMVNQ